MTLRQMMPFGMAHGQDLNLSPGMAILFQNGMYV